MNMADEKKVIWPNSQRAADMEKADKARGAGVVNQENKKKPAMKMPSWKR
jgi:hypothetical protein